MVDYFSISPNCEYHGLREFVVWGGVWGEINGGAPLSIPPLFKKRLDNNTKKGFEEMNKKLKELAEHK